MRSLAIEEPGSLVPALYATLLYPYSIDFDLRVQFSVNYYFPRHPELWDG